VRLLHFSDLHLGIENYGTFDSHTGLSTRVGDFLHVLDVIVERAAADQVDAVLFSGDAFKNRDPSPTLQRELARRVGRLAQSGIPLVMLVGNHDLPNVLTRATPVEIYQILAIPGVHICRSIERVDVNTASGRLQIVALPWITRSLLLANELYRDLGDVDLEREMASLISRTVKQLAEGLDPDVPSILMAHLSVQGASLGYEQSIMLGRDVTVGIDDLDARAFDYVALGHIHKHQQLAVKPPVVYAGSPERIDFGEEREPKGYVEVTIEPSAGPGRETSWRFVELPARAFRTLRVRAAGDDPMPAVRRDVERLASDIDGAVVRCFITVERGRERSVNTQEVRRALLDLGASYVAHVVVDSETVTRARYQIGEDMARDSLRMLEQWIDGRNYDDAMRERVLARGTEIIQRLRHEADGRDDSG
jgi:exonuclease SbcD